MSKSEAGKVLRAHIPSRRSLHHFGIPLGRQSTGIWITHRQPGIKNKTKQNKTKNKAKVYNTLTKHISFKLYIRKARDRMPEFLCLNILLCIFKVKWS